MDSRFRGKDCKIPYAIALPLEGEGWVGVEMQPIEQLPGQNPIQ
jgi:hypothetical protein